MNEQDIHKLLAEGERVILECKKAQNSVPNSLWETYSAFTNTYGGTILLGVVEDIAENDYAKRFTITGVEDADKIRKDIWNTINSKEKVNINLLQDKDIQTVKINGKELIVINVPRAGYNLRPVYINNNLMRGTYRRNHEGDYHCTEQMIRMMVRDAYETGTIVRLWKIIQWTILISQHWRAIVLCSRPIILNMFGIVLTIKSS